MQKKITSHQSKEGVADVRREECKDECLNDSDRPSPDHQRRTRLAMSSNDRTFSMFERYGAEF